MHNLPALSDLRLLCIVLRRGSLAAAAIELGASPSFVSKRVAILEGALEAKLLHRTTRRITPTEEGEAVHRWAQRILADVADMAQEIATADQPRGILRVSTSPGIGRRHVAPTLAEFALRHAAMEVHLELVDRAVDPVRDGFDLDIRVGGLREPHLYAERLADNHRVLCAAPSYLDRHGRPTSPAGLAEHRCLVIRERDQDYAVWRLEGPEGAATVRVRGALSANDGETIRHWALLGHGIMLRSQWDVADDLAAGRLVRLLASHSQAAPIWAVHPARLSRTPKLRIFLRLLAGRLAAGGARADAPHPGGD